MPRDARSYITVHDGMPEHPKIKPLSDKAFRTLHEVWSWCSRNRTDGDIVPAMWKTFGTPRARAELIEVGLIEQTLEGFYAHDYLKHQRSKAEIEELTAKRARAGSAGGRARVANAQALAQAEAEQNASKVQPETETYTEELPSGSSLGAAKRPSTRGTRIPDPFLVTAEMRAWAAVRTPNVNINHSTEVFVNYWRAKAGRDATKVDWLATWKNWLISDEEKAGRAAGGRPLTRTEQNMTVVAEIAAREAAEQRGIAS